MPRGRPRKNPETAIVVEPNSAETIVDTPTSATEAVASVDPMADLKAAIGKAIDADPQGVVKALADVLGVAAATPRTVDGRPRKIEAPKSTQTIPTPEPVEPKPAVVYYAEAAGYRQPLVPYQKKFHGDGNVEMVAGVIAEAENHIIRIEDPEHAKIMDAKIEKQIRKYGKPMVTKLRDEIADQVLSNVKTAVVSQKNTIHDTLADVVQ